MNLGEKPKSLFCYICGREFGTNSLAIHLKKCPSKFDNQQAKKDPKDRRKCPEPPEELQRILSGNYDRELMEIYNQKAVQTHKFQSLAPCRFCGRTFKEESLKPHQNGCSKKDKSISTAGAKNYPPSTQTFKKPRVLQCCICGRQFGLTSLKIHYYKCMEKFKNEENKKPKGERKNCPEFSEVQLEMINNKTDWTEEEINNFNNFANENYRENGMTQCQNCKRKFFAQAYEKHKKNCKFINGDKGGGKIESKEQKGNPESIKKPKTLACCVCGRQFGTNSLKIHYPKCVEKFKTEEAKKPKNERKAAPNFSQEQLEMINNKTDWTHEDLEDFNKLANVNYRDNAMTQCPNCNRKFLPESYLKHKKNCVLLNGEKKTQQSQPPLQTQKFGGEEETLKKPRVLMCHICGREFGLTSLLIHQKKCEIKFTNEESKKPGEERKRLPVFPEQQLAGFDLNNITKWKSSTIDEYNKIANEVYRSQSLSQCPICNRKFFDQSLPKHMKFCEKNFEKSKGLKKNATENESPLPPVKKIPFKKQDPEKSIENNRSEEMGKMNKKTDFTKNSSANLKVGGQGINSGRNQGYKQNMGSGLAKSIVLPKIS